MSLDSARIVLELMIERLEPIVGKAVNADFSHWDGDSAAEILIKRRQESGWFRFARALLDAREALASGYPDKIMQAALICPAFERDGLKLAAVQGFKQAVVQADTAKRRNGGIRRGAALANDARDRWSGYEEMFKILSAGKDYQGRRRARVEVERKMVDDGFVVPRTGEFPTDKTLSAHFPCKENRKSA